MSPAALLRRLFGFVPGRTIAEEPENPKPAPEPTAPPGPAAPADAELAASVDAAVARRFAPLIIDRDLEPLADSVPESELRAARSLLRRAARDGRRDDYDGALRILRNRAALDDLVAHGRET